MPSSLCGRGGRRFISYFAEMCGRSFLAFVGVGTLWISGLVSGFGSGSDSERDVREYLIPPTVVFMTTLTYRMLGLLASFDSMRAWPTRTIGP